MLEYCLSLTTSILESLCSCREPTSLPHLASSRMLSQSSGASCSTSLCSSLTTRVKYLKWDT